VVVKQSSGSGKGARGWKMKMALDCWLLTRASAGIPRRLHEPCREVRAPRWMQCSAGTDASESRCCGLRAAGCGLWAVDCRPYTKAPCSGGQPCGRLMKQSRDGNGEAWPLFFTDGCTTRRDSGTPFFGGTYGSKPVETSRRQSQPVAASRSQSQPCQLHHAMAAMPHFGWPATIAMVAMGAMMHSTVSAGVGPPPCAL
jgi:hypothetical protein